MPTTLLPRRVIGRLREALGIGEGLPGRVRLHTVTLTRWVAVVGQLVAILFVDLFLGIRLPLGALLPAVGLSAAVNLAFARLFQGGQLAAGAQRRPDLRLRCRPAVLPPGADRRGPEPVRRADRAARGTGGQHLADARHRGAHGADPSRHRPSGAPRRPLAVARRGFESAGTLRVGGWAGAQP